MVYFGLILGCLEDEKRMKKKKMDEKIRNMSKFGEQDELEMEQACTILVWELRNSFRSMPLQGCGREASYDASAAAISSSLR